MTPRLEECVKYVGSCLTRGAIIKSLYAEMLDVGQFQAENIQVTSLFEST